MIDMIIYKGFSNIILFYDLFKNDFNYWTRSDSHCGGYKDYLDFHISMSTLIETVRLSCMKVKCPRVCLEGKLKCSD